MFAGRGMAVRREESRESTRAGDGRVGTSRDTSLLAIVSDCAGASGGTAPEFAASRAIML